MEEHYGNPDIEVKSQQWTVVTNQQLLLSQQVKKKIKMLNFVMLSSMPVKTVGSMPADCTEVSYCLQMLHMRRKQEVSTVTVLRDAHRVEFSFSSSVV